MQSHRYERNANDSFNRWPGPPQLFNVHAPYQRASLPGPSLYLDRLRTIGIWPQLLVSKVKGKLVTWTPRRGHAS